MRFDCPRRFGFVKVCHLATSNSEPLELEHLGPEPLSSEFDADYLYKISRKRTGVIKSLIMNNALVVGVGNIYVCEALFKSKIKPQRKASSLSKKECNKLVEVIKEVLLNSIDIGGTTIANYKSVDGSEGKFVQHLQVYGKSNQTCPLCSSAIKQKRIAGRNSYYCPKCQK
jgi:formamidopyrimidine-DNA glycosylase